MGYNLSVDGGGTKLAGVLFDEQLNLVAEGQGQAINYAAMEDIERAMEACIDGCLNGYSSVVLDHVYITMPASSELFVELLRRKSQVKRVLFLNEGAMCLLAGRQSGHGIVALSGTGAGVFRIHGEEWQHMGGWGHMLGDEGSAFCIGRDAIASVLLMMEKRGPQTALYDIILQEWNLGCRQDVIDAVYLAEKPRARVASAAQLVARAAQMGDPVAIGIFEKAGKDMALQANAMLRQYDPGAPVDVLVAGSVWKGCRRMFDVFRESVLRQFPQADVSLPSFEPVVGGVFAHLFEQGGQADEPLLERMKEQFARYVYTTQWTNS